MIFLNIFNDRRLRKLTKFQSLESKKQPISMDQMVQFLLDEMSDNSSYRDNPERKYSYQRSLSNVCKVPCKLLKVIAQIQGVVEICCQEAEGAFIAREKDDLKLLQYPEPHHNDYEDIVHEKIEYVRQEGERNVIIEGGRRRFSMLVENVIDPDLYVAGLADFLYTITSTMKIDLRPKQRSGAQGQFCKFEEGILCQRNNPYPGLEIKLTTGSDDTASGWYAAVISIVRRLIMQGNFDSDNATTMLKTSINIKGIDQEKANTILKALRSHEETATNYNIGRRKTVPAGRVVSHYITEAAAIVKRLFMAKTEGRLNLAEEKYDSPLEMDRCFGRLGGAQKRAVLRFCKSCNYSKSSTLYDLIQTQIFITVY